MALTILTPGTQLHPGSSWSVLSYTLATTETAQTLDVDYDVLNVGMGTDAATSSENAYLLATDDSRNGRTVWIQATATGRANLKVGGGTATGMWVITTATDVMAFQQRDTGWMLVHNSGATNSTST